MNFTLHIWRQTGPLDPGQMKTYQATNVNPDMSFLEMLDEEQQLRNFRAQLRDGREVPDESAARVTVISALRAVTELHRKQPGMDLKDLNEPIAKLAASDNTLLSKEAKQTQLALAR